MKEFITLIILSILSGNVLACKYVPVSQSPKSIYSDIQPGEEVTWLGRYIKDEVVKTNNNEYVLRSILKYVPVKNGKDSTCEIIENVEEQYFIVVGKPSKYEPPTNNKYLESGYRPPLIWITGRVKDKDHYNRVEAIQIIRIFWKDTDLEDKT